VHNYCCSLHTTVQRGDAAPSPCYPRCDNPVSHTATSTNLHVMQCRPPQTTQSPSVGCNIPQPMFTCFIFGSENPESHTVEKECIAGAGNSSRPHQTFCKTYYSTLHTACSTKATLGRYFKFPCRCKCACVSAEKTTRTLYNIQMAVIPTP
jgi:hypothetical protein